ncbi:hypothetical protein GLOIN_2v1883854 [Rhizophagus clarus]|uniref:SWIM-type domain-containing protein n=1 Tax=Rhizophagus clarus TaxID=94130 RepID=A0A8H3LCR0_9GLOM|nr:hypothetical protein GLOIN_2v1883854 [Rhizophagus clarus]
MEGDNTENIQQIYSWNLLPDILKPVLPCEYTYLIQKLDILLPYQTQENFKVENFELDAFVDVCNKEEASGWVAAFESHSKTTMPESKSFKLTGNRRLQSSRARDINCTASIHIRLERRKLIHTHPLEINIKFTHNHVINSAESLSFRRIKDEVKEKFIELFKDGHSPSSALIAHEDELHINATNDQELLEILSDRANNPDYNSVFHLFQKYRDTVLGSRNGSQMFIRLGSIVKDYNNSASLMCRVHKKIPQAGELYYMDTSASFEQLNTSITLLYTSCAVGALPLRMFITSDELETTLEKAIGLLKTILPEYAFFGCGPLVGPVICLTDDSSAERKALELCWPKGVRLLCTFHVLQAFWRWLHDPKHKIKKEDQASIMEKVKKILYASSSLEMDTHYCEFAQTFYYFYQLLRKHFEILWGGRQFWAHSFRVGLPIRGNHTNNYIERSFGILKDIIFTRTQAYNCVQVFQFVVENMERFYERRLLGIAHKHPGHLRIAKHFLCPGWEGMDANFINETGVRNEFSVQSTRKDDLFYIVNSEIGTCTCPVGVSGAPCKHQGAVAMKYHIAILNFIPLLTPQDRMVYAYVALGYVSKDNSSSLPDNVFDETIEWRESNKEIIEIDYTALTTFLEEVKADYQSDNPQLRTALDKFADRYRSAKSKSIPRLTSFLYDINRDLDPAARVKSDSMIRVQVESVKRRKTESSGSRKRKLPNTIREEKENLDPHVIPARKKRVTAKKSHDLSMHIAKNQPN